MALLRARGGRRGGDYQGRHDQADAAGKGHRCDLWPLYPDAWRQDLVYSRRLSVGRADAAGRGAIEVSAFIVRAVMSSVDVLRQIGDARLAGTDWTSLDTAINKFTAAYRAEIDAW